MALETWVTFALVSFALLVMPGPLTLYIGNSVILHGRAKAVKSFRGRFWETFWQSPLHFWE